MNETPLNGYLPDLDEVQALKVDNNSGFVLFVKFFCQGMYKYSNRFNYKF